MAKFSIFATALVASIAQSAAFAPVSSNNVQQPSTQLRMMSNDDVTKTIGSSMVAASLFVSSIFTPEAAIAATSDNFDFGASSSLIAAKSGGRAGGRSSASTMRSSPPPRPSSQSTTTINRTTVIQAPAAPVVVAPPPVVVGGGYGYNPFMPSPLGKFVITVFRTNQFVVQISKFTIIHHTHNIRSCRSWT